MTAGSSHDVRREADESSAASPDGSAARRDADEYWQYVERIAKQVDTWPDWKKKDEWLSTEEESKEK